MSFLKALRKGRGDNVRELTYEQRKAVYAWLVCYCPSVKAERIQTDFRELVYEGARP
ncbi:hypothetical protein MUP01_12010 [Candidatus Bathyarchaeota archaeon]|nr:hypothetical protein [Candidatus Bathyarchaeota archaeon]